jgi:phosphatidylinositol 3,5-bisphosphate 5-phosphatase
LRRGLKITRVVPTAYAILGFVKFLKGYYIIMVTERRRVAKIGLHSIYCIKKTEMVCLFNSVENTNRDEEQTYVNLFQQFEVAKNFYFSYTYDLTHSL